VFGHHGTLAEGTLNVGDHVAARVNTLVRGATVRNHSVTHLMHKALREVLGGHVQQKGSLVNAERTRFDFTHNAPLTDVQIREIELRVNAEIVMNAATQARVMDIESAQKTGAMMLFGEKYGETVRVLDIGTSRELCGGTHVQRTGDIGLFKIIAEGGVAAGVRRIEAVTGLNALAYVQGMEATLGGVAGTLRVTPGEVPARISAMLEQARELEKEARRPQGQAGLQPGRRAGEPAVDVKGVKVLAARLEGADAKTLRETMDKLKDKLKTAAIVLAAVDGDKVQLAAGVTADTLGKVKAGELVNFVAQQVGGKGGGKPDMAMAGGTDHSTLGLCFFDLVLDDRSRCAGSCARCRAIRAAARGIPQPGCARRAGDHVAGLVVPCARRGGAKPRPGAGGRDAARLQGHVEPKRRARRTVSRLCGPVERPGLGCDRRRFAVAARRSRAVHPARRHPQGHPDPAAP
jgi:alanyl-tRNA synthetase